MRSRLLSFLPSHTHTGLNTPLFLFALSTRTSLTFKPSRNNKPQHWKLNVNEWQRRSKPEMQGREKQLSGVKERKVAERESEEEGEVYLEVRDRLEGVEEEVGHDGIFLL